MTSPETLKTDWQQPTTGGAINKDLLNKIGRAVNEKALDVAVVHKAGTETIAGAKTFTTPVTVPTPTALLHAATKQYVDTAVAAGVGSGGSGGSGGGGTTPSTYEVETDFTNKSVGAMPAVADTGQPVWMMYNPTANAIPVISNTVAGPRYTIASTDAAARAGYYNVELANANVTRLKSRFRAGVGLQAWRDRFAPGQLATAVQGASCHAAGLTTGCSYGIWNQSTGLAILANRVYSTARSATADQELDIRIDKTAGKAWMTGDDGVETPVVDSRIAAYDCKFGCCEIYYGNAATEPRQEISNFKASSAPGGLPSGGSSGGSGSGSTTNNDDYGRVNARDKGAVGDGVTDDSAAGIAVWTAVEAAKVTGFQPYADPRGSKEVYYPPGTYLFKQPNALFGDVGSLPFSGVDFRGGGLDATTIVFQPTAANQSLAYNPDRFYHLNFENMSIYVDGPYASTAKIFDSLSNGHAQNYAFHRVQFGGAPKYGLALRGTNNNSEMKFNQCQFHTDHPGGGAFLYSPPPGSGGSDQFVNFQFTDSDIEHRTGDFVQLGSGGCVNIHGGSIVHAGDGNQTTSTRQRLVSMLGATHDVSADNVSIRDVRVEHRHINSQLLYSERSRGNIVLENVQAEVGAWGMLSAPQNLKQVEIVGGDHSYPTVKVTDSTLIGQQVYHYGANSYKARPNMKYERVNFVDPVNLYKRAVDFFTMVADGGTTNVAGAPFIPIEDCGAEAIQDQTEIFDCTLNWRTAINRPMTSREAFFRGPAGGPSNGLTMKLPLWALITGFSVSKKAGGTATGTNVAYTLVNGDGTTIATLGSGGANWNTAWRTSAGQLSSYCDTEAQRTLTIQFANINETMADLSIAVHYRA